MQNQILANSAVPPSSPRQVRVNNVLRAKAIARSVAALLVACVVLPAVANSAAQSEQFDKYEIRVIRPKYFTKSGRLETGAQLSVIMNQSFIYTYLATGILDYHFNELLALEGAAAYGFSIDKDDKKSLDSTFKIKTQIIRTQYFMEGGVVYTPVYGKYQISTGRVVYLDTFFTAGAGMTGVSYLYDHCAKPEDGGAATVSPPAATTKSYPTFYMGGGQRIFLDKKTSLRWDVRGHFFTYDKKDGACNPAETASESKLQTNITVQLGAGYFL